MSAALQPPPAGTSGGTAPAPEQDTPWIETRPGGWFFVNALLVAPVGMVLVPLLFGALVRGLGWVQGPSAVLDTIPAMAWYFAPRIGWLAAPAAWLAWRSRARTDRAGPRFWLAVFALAHLAVLGFTVLRWMGVAPGAPALP